MAKIGLTKITSKKVIPPKKIELGDAEIYIQQFLPIDDKAALIERVLNNAVDDMGNFSPIRLKVYLALETIRTYTNINITETQMNNPGKTYDLLITNDVLKKVLDIIPEKEYDELVSDLYECADMVGKYNHSAAGIMKAITSDYRETKMDVDGLLQELSDPEQVGLVKDILTKL